MKLVPRGGTWAVHFTDTAGNRKRVSTGEKDEALARVKAVEIMREHFVDALAPEDRRKAGTNVTLAGALAATYDAHWRMLKSKASLRYRIGKIAREIGHWPLSAITFQRLEDWATDLLDEGRKPATINRYMTAIHTSMDRAWKRGEIAEVPPFPHYEENNIKERYLSDAEERVVLNWYDANAAPADTEAAYMRALFTVLLDTGMRCTEAATLTEANVRRAPNGDLIGVWLQHGTTKNGSGRTVPLTARAADAVGVLLASPHGRGAVNSDWIGRRWRTLRDKLAIEGASIHTLRHTCASRLVQAGVALQVVMEWLGHRSMTVTMRYAHLAPAQFADALAKLEGRTSEDRVASTAGTVPQGVCQPDALGTLSTVIPINIKQLGGAKGGTRSCS